MGLFGKKSDSDALDDAALIQAARKRIMAELEAKSAGGGGMSSTINNYAGGGGGGLMERMNGATGGGDADLRDYLVDIERRDLPELNEHTGKPVGWTKKVRRHVEEKKK